MKLSKADRAKLLRDNLQNYEKISAHDQKLLSRKIPREAFKDLLDRVGALLVEEAHQLAAEPGPVREFLEFTALPESLADLLPPDFRAFCLVLKALKIWVSAEQAATDRYLMGGRARDELRAVTDRCIVTGQRFKDVGCQLHHPVRDGRPPIPLSPEGHQIIEGQNSANGAAKDKSNGASESTRTEPNLDLIYKIRARNGRSFLNLRRGCLDLMGVSVVHGTAKVGASSRTFARKASEATGLSHAAILELLDEYSLGLEVEC